MRDPNNVVIENNEPLYVDLYHSFVLDLVTICTAIEDEIYLLDTNVPI